MAGGKTVLSPRVDRITEDYADTGIDAGCRSATDSRGGRPHPQICNIIQDIAGTQRYAEIKIPYEERTVQPNHYLKAYILLLNFRLS